VSMPPEPGQTTKRPTIEPTYVMRRRRTEALAELLREFEQYKGTTTPKEEYETVAVPPGPGPAPAPDRPTAPDPEPAPERLLPRTDENETEELPPVRVGEDFATGAAPRAGRRPRRRPAPGGGAGLKRAAVVVGVGAAALLGFGAALLLPGGETRPEARPTTPTPSAPAADAPAPSAPARDAAADPDGPGTLREGDSGPEVSELQQRLRRIPNVYDNGPTSGEYDVVLREAVARFQLWYGIRGDETGVYGDDTRKDLESRTTA
jgi:hypothetical protein